jgi:hypothetical protein
VAGMLNIYAETLDLTDYLLDIELIGRIADKLYQLYGSVTETVVQEIIEDSDIIHGDTDKSSTTLEITVPAYVVIYGRFKG